MICMRLQSNAYCAKYEQVLCVRVTSTAICTSTICTINEYYDMICMNKYYM